MRFKNLEIGADFLSAAGVTYKKTGENTSSYGGEDGYKFGSDELVDKIEWSTKECPNSKFHYKPTRLDTCLCGATFEIVEES